MDELAEWRCTCLVRLLFGFYTPAGGLHLRRTGRSTRRTAYRGQIVWFQAHCPACHADSELAYDDEAHTFIPRERHARRALAQCPICPVPER